MEGNIKELLTRGQATEGSLLIPKTIYNILWEAVQKKLLPRDIAAIYVGPDGIPGSSIDIDLETADSMSVVRVAEGAAVPIGVSAYTSINVKPSKYGIRPYITKEMIEDGKWDLITYNIKRAGIEMAENETSTIITGALDSAGNTITGGAAITVANITRAIQYLEDNDFTATDFIVGPEVMNDLRNIDLFVNVASSGSDQALRTGAIPVIYNMSVHQVSGNIITTTSSYVVDRNHGYVLVEKRPVTVEKYDDYTHDMSGAVVTQRFAVNVLRANAIAKITTT